jgi:nicotinic acid phosphoribosyltransferase
MIDFLDQDQYSLTCCQFILEHYPDINVSYKFIDRNQTRLNHPDVFLTKLKSKINSFVDINLDMQFEQISYLRNGS